MTTEIKAKNQVSAEPGPDNLVYGNKDTEKKFPFPYKEKGYYHLKLSRSMHTPSGVEMEDPGSIRHQKYDIQRFQV